MNTVQPNDDQRCIWMNAGVISYKLCDYDFNCDYCPLDIVLRKTVTHDSDCGSVTYAGSVETRIPTDLEDDVARLLSPFTSCSIADEMWYSPEHMWIREFNRKMALVGMDSFLVSLVPSSASIVLDAQKTHVDRGTPFGWIYFQKKALPLLSPLSGTILRHNILLNEDLVLLQENNYDLGWLVSLLPDGLEEERDTLLPAVTLRLKTKSDMNAFIDRTTARLHTMAEPNGLCLNDGGVPVSSLLEALGADAYHDIIREFFTASR